jgi:hypothetical protein
MFPLHHRPSLVAAIIAHVFRSKRAEHHDRRLGMVLVDVGEIVEHQQIVFVEFRDCCLELQAAHLFAAIRSVIGTAARRGIDAYQAIRMTLKGSYAGI